MRVFAISDLHLSFFKEKPMDIFGTNWKNHPDKIKKNWLETVTDDDTILIPGDISWAKKMTEFSPDINFIHSLTGKKVFVSGNHDYWWGSVSALNKMFSDMFFIKNNFYSLGEFAVCGSRGWLCPNDTFYTSHDEKIYKRESARLKLSLDLAINKGFKRIIAMLHYPPTNDKKESSLFEEILKAYPVEKVVYGHLHGKENFNLSYRGKIDKIDYILVSADFLDFKPVRIL